MNKIGFNMLQLKRFAVSETGAVTVDWVVLTAALVGLGLATMTVVSGGTQDLATDVDNQLSNSYIIFQSQNFGKSPYDMIEGLELEVGQFGSLNPTERLQELMEDRTEAQLQNGLQNQQTDVDDPDFDGNPALARDQVKIITLAMDVNGWTPN